MTVGADEVIEPLDGELNIIQPKNGYRFGADSVALAKFACDRIKSNSYVIDLCSGCGVIGLLMHSRTGAKVIGVEYDPVLFDMSVRSSEGLENVRFINADVRRIEDCELSLGRFDAVVCNPPFFKADSKPASIAPSANSELTIEFSDVCRAAKTCLKQGGKFFVVHTASRLDEVLDLAREYTLMPKELLINRNGKTFLLMCALGGKSGLRVQTGDFPCFI